MLAFVFRLLPLFAFCFVCIPAVAASADSKALNIAVTAFDDSRFRISISFIGEADGTTDIRLPNEWGGQRELYKAIRDLAVSPASAKLTETPETHVKTVSHKPGEKLTVTYELAQDFQGPLKNAVRYRPVTDKDFIHWIGNAVWVLPDWEDDTKTDISIEWRNFPRDWSVANSFGTGKRKQNFSIRFGDLRQAIFVAGDFRVARTKAKGNAVNIAIRGTWQFRDEELADMIRKVIETERDFFNDHSQKYYLVTLVPIDGGGPNSFSTGGTGLTDSFALFATPNATIERFRGLLAHEYAHNWIPGKLGKMPSENEQEFYWFSEGFTDFYAYRLLHRGGLITEAEFVDRYNESIREYYTLPVRTEPNESIVKDFWTDRDVQRLPYLRGFLFATNLDADIKRSSGGKASLDDAIHELFQSSKTDRRPLSFESLSGVFYKYLGSDAMPAIRRHLIEGELITPYPDALGGKITQEIVQMPVFELGFDFEHLLQTKEFSGVMPGTAAYEAGIRNGQKLVGGISISLGDTTKEVEFKVSDNEGEKTIRYLPVARKRIPVPQFRQHSNTFSGANF